MCFLVKNRVAEVIILPERRTKAPPLSAIHKAMDEVYYRDRVEITVS